MFFGRLFGWAMIGLALLLASMDAVMALGPRDYAPIAAGDLWILVSGQSSPSGLRALILGLPAWLVVGPMGLLMAWACRRRHKRWLFRKTA